MARCLMGVVHRAPSPSRGDAPFDAALDRALADLLVEHATPLAPVDVTAAAG